MEGEGRKGKLSEADLAYLALEAKAAKKAIKKTRDSKALSIGTLFEMRRVSGSKDGEKPGTAVPNSRLFTDARKPSEALTVKSGWSEFDNFEKSTGKLKKEKNTKEEERLKARFEELGKLEFVVQPVIKDLVKDFKKPRNASNIKFDPSKANEEVKEALLDKDTDEFVADLEEEFERILTKDGNERLFLDLVNQETETVVDTAKQELVVKAKERNKDFNLFSTFKVSDVDPKESYKTKKFAIEQRKKNDVFGELYRDMVQAGASSQEKRAFQLMLLKYRTLTRGILSTFPPLPQVENFENPDEFLMSKVCKSVTKKPRKLTFMDGNNKKVTVKFHPPAKTPASSRLKAEQDAFEKESLKPRSLKEISRRRPVIRSSTEAAVIAYHDRANLSFIIDYLMTFVMYNAPDNPIEFIYDLTKKVVAARKEKKLIEELPRLYEKKHMEAYFRLLDQEERGYISLRQYKSALQSLGVYEYKEDPFGFNEDRIPEHTFVNEAWREVENNFMLFLSPRN